MVYKWKTLLKWMIFGYHHLVASIFSFTKSQSRPQVVHETSCCTFVAEFGVGCSDAILGGAQQKAPVKTRNHGKPPRIWSLRIQSPCQIMIGVYNHLENSKTLLYTLLGTNPYPTKREVWKVIDSKVPFKGDMLVPWRVITP